jgi:deoxyribodipyrimidine photo-lyase
MTVNDHTPGERRTALLWVRQDLRLADNPALAAAMRAGAVLPAFVLDAAAEAPWAPGGASRWWLHHSLHALQRAYRARGGRLILRRGPTLATLLDLVRESAAATVDVTEPVSFKHQTLPPTTYV